MCYLQVISFSVFIFYPLMLCFLLDRTLFLAAECQAAAPAEIAGPHMQDHYLGGGLLWDKEGRKEVIMETHVCVLFITFFSLSCLERHRFSGLPLSGGFRLHPGLHTRTQVLYIPVVLLSMFLEVLWVFEGKSVHMFRTVSLKGLACLG